MDKLKACPFEHEKSDLVVEEKLDYVGGGDGITEEQFAPEYDVMKYRVRCQICGCHRKWTGHEEYAIELWNARVWFWQGEGAGLPRDPKGRVR